MMIHFCDCGDDDPLFWLDNKMDHHHRSCKSGSSSPHFGFLGTFKKVFPVSASKLEPNQSWYCSYIARSCSHISYLRPALQISITSDFCSTYRIETWIVQLLTPTVRINSTAPLFFWLQESRRRCNLDCERRLLGFGSGISFLFISGRQGWLLMFKLRVMYI